MAVRQFAQFAAIDDSRSFTSPFTSPGAPFALDVTSVDCGRHTMSRPMSQKAELTDADTIFFSITRSPNGFSITFSVVYFLRRGRSRYLLKFDCHLVTYSSIIDSIIERGGGLLSAAAFRSAPTDRPENNEAIRRNHLKLNDPQYSLAN